jgi:NADH:ubiquinone oxidoreductase subunit 5 (subunit L)/multisubunit Na+/H+ antiporter MnhA subunit
VVLHALFKAMIFLGSGSLIVQFGGVQDSRFYGAFFFGYCSKVYLFIGSLSLMGFPFLVGFYSKDVIITEMESVGGLAIVALFFVCCILTVLYTVRILFRGFVNGWVGAPVSGFNERGEFFWPVSVLLLWCIFSGAFISSSFWLGSLFMFRCLDYFLGVYIILAGTFSILLLVGTYGVVVFFSLMGFVRWLSTGGMSVFLRRMLTFKGEGRWLEVVGGQGLFSSLAGLSNRFGGFHSLSLKGLLGFLGGSLVVIFYLSYSFWNVSLKMARGIGHSYVLNTENVMFY